MTPTRMTAIALAMASSMAMAVPAQALVYCTHVGVPKGCTVRHGVVLAPEPSVVARRAWAWPQASALRASALRASGWRRVSADPPTPAGRSTGSAAAEGQRTRTLRNCQGSEVSKSSGNSPGRSVSGVHSV
jgi:hypothetical protein